MPARRAVLAGVAALVVPSVARADRPPLAALPLSRADLGWWRERHAAKLAEIHSRGQIDLVFLGDSITQQWERAGPPAFLDYRPVWDRFYGDRRALNLGFKGDATSHLLWRIENGELAGISPPAVVLLIGANNFGHLHWSADDTVQGIAAVLAAVRAQLPTAQIIVLSVLPSDRGAWVANSTRRTNAILATAISRGMSHVRFLDLTPTFTRNGRVDRSLYADPRLPHPAPALHPDAVGQTRIAEELEPLLSSILRDRDHRQ